MKDKFAKFLVALFLIFTMVGCTVSTKVSLFYSVGTGDSVKVELDTSDGYKLSNVGDSFEVHKDDTVVATSMFLISDGTEMYTQTAIDNGGIEYDGGYTFELEGSKFFVKKLSDKTGIIIDYKDDDVLSRLTFTVQ